MPHIEKLHNLSMIKIILEELILRKHLVFWNEIRHLSVTKENMSSNPLERPSNTKKEEEKNDNDATRWKYITTAHTTR